MGGKSVGGHDVILGASCFSFICLDSSATAALGLGAWTHSSDLLLPTLCVAYIVFMYLHAIHFGSRR